jgi:hypothetical protein
VSTQSAVANGAEPAGVVGDSGGAISIGLTKREFLAAMAMQGLLANSAIDMTPRDFATCAVKHADVLLDALAQVHL